MRKIFVLASLAATAVAFTGCDGNRAAMAPKETNVLGIVTHQDESYAATGPATFAISSDEIGVRKNYSGKKTELLWGLITLKDY